MKVFTVEPILVLILIAAASAATDLARECGQKQVVLVQQLPLNGNKVPAGAWPWLGAMYHRKPAGQQSYACGVTILTEQYVITAAHCTIDPQQAAGRQRRLPANRVFVRVGMTNLEAPERHYQQHDVDRIIRHDEYDEATLGNDVALMKLYTELTFNDYVQPICLWQVEWSLRKVMLRVGYTVGWRHPEEDYRLPKGLNEAAMSIVSSRECNDIDPNYYATLYHFQPRTFCAVRTNGTAPGDTGGGLYLRIGNSWVLWGIVSILETDPDSLEVDSSSNVLFTDASKYTSWINRHVAIRTEPIESSLSEDSDSQPNLLNIPGCGKDSYRVGTPEESKGYLNQYPWLGVIEYRNTITSVLEDLCHGVLIHPRFLVTTAHCIRPRQTSVIRSVRFNDYRLDTIVDVFQVIGNIVQTTTERIAVVGISTHSNYNRTKFSDDIGLIKLERPSTATPICLPTTMGSSLPAQKQFTIIGWKKNPHQEKKPMIRNVVQLSDFDICRRKYAEYGITLDTSGGQVCSSYSRYDDSSSSSKNCSHFMGSVPFVYSQNGPHEKRRYFLAAISSFGPKCENDYLPVVFTDVAHYLDWILDKINRNA